MLRPLLVKLNGAASHLKPLLKKILPQKLLRAAKGRVVALSLQSATQREPADLTLCPDGVNFIGFIRARIGLGQSCRAFASVLSRCPFPFTIYNVEPSSNIQYKETAWDSKITQTLPYNINLIHFNPDELAVIQLELPKEAWQNKYQIAFWAWELEEIPESWCRCFPLLDEVWTPSEFAAAAIRKRTDLPVTVMPHYIAAEVSPQYNRAYFGLPEGQFLFLCMYDCNSTMERKNPLGAIRAFKEAFPSQEQGVGLIVKVNNPQEKDLQILKRELAGYGNVCFITRSLSKVEVNSLIQCADVFVSLHRSEGFGLVMAEAMLLGTPAVATNWSANTEFMDDSVACMIDYRLVPLTQDYGPYKKGNRWAEPDVDKAARAMKRLYTDPAFYRQLQERGRAHIQEKLSVEAIAQRLARRVEEIYAARKGQAGEQ